MTTWRRLGWAMGMAVLAAAAAIALALTWGPLAKPDLARASVRVVPAPGVRPPAGLDDVLAIIYSGDGGWADLDRQLGGAFAQRGIPVLGVDTFTYFWRERAPHVAAAQLDALITQYLEQWHKQRVWLLGYSFGADVLPTLVRRISPGNRARIPQLVLLSPGRELTFEIQFQSYMLGNGRIKAFVKKLLEQINPVQEYAALPPLLALAGGVPVTCYYGTEEAGQSLCTQAQLPPGITVHGRAGGHHLGQDYDGLAQDLLTRLPTAAAPAHAVAGGG